MMLSGELAKCAGSVDTVSRPEDVTCADSESTQVCCRNVLTRPGSAAHITDASTK